MVEEVGKRRKGEGRGGELSAYVPTPEGCETGTEYLVE